MPGIAIVALAVLLAAKANAQPAYDLTGTWILAGNDVQNSFCDGSSSVEPVVTPVIVVQNGETTVMVVPGESFLTGRTANRFVAVEEIDENATTVLTGTVLENADRITGTLVFFDKHACPEAETGQTRFVMFRVR